jgi:cation:H+ antiporter
MAIMLLNILILLAGFFVLIYGADQLVKGASSFAKRAGVSSLVIGLTIVAFGSSAPELIVNVFAALRGSSEIALANVMGSNIANIFLVLGIAALVRPLVVDRLPVWREIPFAILGTGMVLALSMDSFLGNGANVISRGEGIALLGFFSIFLYFTGMSVLRSRAKNGEEKIAEYKKGKSWFMIIIGLGGLILGGKLIVDSAVSIATAFHVSEALIGLTVIAIGTSLPELVTSIVAAYKGHTDMAIGNVVGSVIFNALWIVGLSATITPLAVHPGGEVEIWIAFMAAFLLFPFMINGKRVGELMRWEGAMFILFYIAFIGFSIWRG